MNIRPLLYVQLAVTIFAAAVAAGGALLMILPADAWPFLMTRLYGVPFPVLAAGAALLLLLFIGVFVQGAWRRASADAISYATDAVKGEAGPPSGQQELLHAIYDLQEQVARQTQHARQIAAEKADVREQSLQEVVIQERTRLARELHDSVSQQLFAASMLTAAINETAELDEKTADQFRLVENMINQSQLEMRALLLHLRPAALKGRSLIDGMDELLAELQQKVPLDIVVSLEEVALDKGSEDHLFRILQEAVSNCLRHAEATRLKVFLLNRDEKAILQVIDNGKGFEAGKDAFGSYGLSTMKERAEEIGGRFRIISVPGEGTKVDVQLPLWKEEKA
ncbi:sensor histidine kinase [Alkalicoccus luteus]|uniref:Sensor histidine kinase n=1 Tax=Alkalicoccus luteus TaxID=1237094 RepID=A0A969PM63_9BACI|nr:sensor histidine kinase [Alkalicoccus luteus]NJP36746.1 sensor histidine kinase [Alkalicoccus luteus]